LTGLEIVGPCFAILSALSYGTGFLCVYTFLERIGIREEGGEFLKGKYFYVGILFLLFPISIACPIIFAASLRRIQNKMGLTLGHAARIPRSSYFLLFNLCVVFYLNVLFLPPSLARDPSRQFAVLLIITLSTVAPWLLRLVIASAELHAQTIKARHIESFIALTD
jgi:hypothetical protein